MGGVLFGFLMIDGNRSDAIDAWYTIRGACRFELGGRVHFPCTYKWLVTCRRKETSACFTFLAQLGWWWEPRLLPPARLAGGDVSFWSRLWLLSRDDRRLFTSSILMHIFVLICINNGSSREKYGCASMPAWSRPVWDFYATSQYFLIIIIFFFFIIFFISQFFFIVRRLYTYVFHM